MSNKNIVRLTKKIKTYNAMFWHENAKECLALGGYFTDSEIVYLCESYKILTTIDRKLLDYSYYKKNVDSGNISSHWFYFFTRDKSLIKLIRSRD